MKEFILLGLVSLSWATIQVDLTKTCPCANFLEETNCNGVCIWKNNTCNMSRCEDYTEIDCPTNLYGGCEWDTTCKTATGGNCKNYTIKSICNSMSKYQNCAWQIDSNNNSYSCLPFTKCSDYVPGTNGCSSKSGSFQACKNNAAGTACEDVSNDTVTCASYLTVDVCTGTENTQPNLCVWDFTLSTCIVWTTCSQLSQSACSSQFCTMDNDLSCRNKVCSDYITRDSCRYIFSIVGYSSQLGSYTTANLCSWNEESSKCAEADITTWTDINTCSINSFQTFYWNGNKCTQCGSSSSTNPSGSDSISSGTDPTSNSNSSGSNSNTNNSSSGSNTTTPGQDSNSNSSNSNSSDSNSSTALTIDLTKTCPCANLPEEKDCSKITTMCIWKNNSCNRKICEEYTETDCPENIGLLVCEWDTTCKPAVGGNCKKYTYETFCQLQSKFQNCVWQNDSYSCLPFTKCSDYVPGTNGCSSKSGRFQACKNNADGTACEDASFDSVTCASYLTVDVCTNTYNGQCIWDQSSSKCTDFKSCTQFSGGWLCSQLVGMCALDDNESCRNFACSDYKTKDLCNYIFNFGYSLLTNTYETAKICQWNEESLKCADGTQADISNATSIQTCVMKSLATYYWDGNKCTQCVSSGSDYLVFRIMVGLLVLII